MLSMTPKMWTPYTSARGLVLAGLGARPLSNPVCWPTSWFDLANGQVMALGGHWPSNILAALAMT
jgi:hypothetical protein